MDNSEQVSNRPEGSGGGRVIAGLFVLGIGAVFFMKELGYEFPWWLFTWPMILIAIGIFSALRHNFHGGAWAILILIGGIFLLDEIIPGFSLHRFAWPVAIIAVGLILIVRPRKHRWDRNPDWRKDWKKDWAQKHSNFTYNEKSQTYQDQHGSSEDYFDSTSIFGGVKKIILSKDFKGADITCFMGGCEIDFTQADLQKPAIIDVTQIFGGTKITVPSNWQVRTEMTSIFSGIEDKRKQPLTPSPDKLLIIHGTSLFGGIEIRNY